MRHVAVRITLCVIGSAWLGCTASRPDTPTPNATLETPLVQKTINLSPEYPLRVRNSDMLQMLPVIGLGDGSEAATLAKMRSICGRFPNVTIEFRGDATPVRITSPAAINGVAAEEHWPLHPYLDDRAREVISPQSGPSGALVRGDVIIAMRSQQYDYMISHGDRPGLPNRLWGTYLVMTFERIFEIQPLPNAGPAYSGRE